MTDSITASQAAAQYIAKGWSPVPVPWRSKGPTEKGWNDPARVFSPDDFHDGQNIGLRLGRVSNELTDVDVDAQEALAAAPIFLPVTSMISGRKSRAQSHYFYLAFEPLLTVRFEDPVLKVTDPDKATIVELRANAKNGTCVQTLVPPSVHPLGEQIAWVNGFNPATVKAEDLITAVKHIAVTALIGRYWTSQGEHGHDLVLALSGALLRSGLKAGDVERIVRTAATIAGYRRFKASDVHDTAQALSTGRPVTGWRRLQERLNEKIVKELRKWVGESASQPAASVAAQQPDSDDETVKVPEFSAEILEGTYIGELALALTTGTKIAPQLAYASIKTCLGAIIDRRVGFPGHEDIHTRHFSINVSAMPRDGKGESWERTGGQESGALSGILAECRVLLEDGARFGSGQFMIKTISELEKANGGQVDLLVRFDEMKELFDKANIRASTLINVLCTLYEKHSIKQGSFTHGDWAVEDTHLSLSGDLTVAALERCFQGRGATGQGFLPRCTLTLAKRQAVLGDWPKRNIEAEQEIVGKMRSAFKRLPEGRLFVPEETPTAKEARLNFFAELESQLDQGSYFPLEVNSHFKRDLLLRVVFSEDQIITLEETKRSIAWAKNQLNVRRDLWPEDIGSLTEAMERKIMRALRSSPGPLSDRDLMKSCHAHRAGSGGAEVYNRAIRAVKFCSLIQAVGKTRTGNPLWAIAAAD